MSLKKKHFKTRPTTRVTFRLPAEAAGDAREVFLVGDFNRWDPRATPMQRLKSGEFKTTLELDSGRHYQFRYLIDGQLWENDWEADGYSPSGFQDSENSVVQV